MYTDQRADIQSATAGWLQDVPWQLFATLKFPSARIRFETAHSKFHKMLHTVEQSLRTRVGCVYAAETRSKSSGAIVPLHFHVALVALQPIEYQMVMGAWYRMTMMGASSEDRADNSKHDLTRVKPYDPARGGIEYIVKQIAEDHCQWGMKDVEFFSRSMPKPHMSPRAARRWQEQLHRSHWLSLRGATLTYLV